MCVCPGGAAQPLRRVEARPGAEAFPSSLDKPKLSRGLGGCGLVLEGYNFGRQSIRSY